MAGLLQGTLRAYCAGTGAGGTVQSAGAHRAHLVVSQGPERFQASDKADEHLPREDGIGMGVGTGVKSW